MCFRFYITGSAAAISIPNMASGIKGKFQCPDPGVNPDIRTYEDKFVNPFINLLNNQELICKSVVTPSTNMRGMTYTPGLQTPTGTNNVNKHKQLNIAHVNMNICIYIYMSIHTCKCTCTSGCS
jgi:hypothetical protein